MSEERLFDGSIVWWATPDGGATYHCYVRAARAVSVDGFSEMLSLCGRSAGTMTGESKHSPPRLRCHTCAAVVLDVEPGRRACDIARANRLVRDLSEKVR